MFRVAVENGAAQPVTAADLPESINFALGRPDVQTVLGSVRLFRENGVPVGGATGKSRTLCVIAVPTYLSVRDFCHWVSPFAGCIQHVRIVRDPLKGVGRYMVLMRFTTQDAADSFFRGFNGKPFGTRGPEACHVVYVAQVALQAGRAGDEALLSSDPLCTPAFVAAVAPAGPSSTAAPGISAGATELPTCPVCLERLDPDASGLLTTICAHSMHSACIIPAADGCPVCRYCEEPPEAAAGAAADEDDTTECEECRCRGEHLWMCLVCGHVGCGRYRAEHALAHFRATSHAYAIELATQRVWDYAGDGYVHRLIVASTDGKVVELPDPRATTASLERSRLPPDTDVAAGLGGSGGHVVLDPVWISGRSGGGVARDKAHAIALEYSLLLTSQLETQRAFYEDALVQLLSLVPLDEGGGARDIAEAIVNAHVTGSGGPLALGDGRERRGSVEAAGAEAPGGVSASPSASSAAAKPPSPADTRAQQQQQPNNRRSRAALRRLAAAATPSAAAGVPPAASAVATLSDSSAASAAERIAVLEAQLATLAAEACRQRERCCEAEERCGDLESRLSASEKARKAAQRQAAEAAEGRVQVQKELAFLRDVSDSMAANQSQWQAAASSTAAQVAAARAEAAAEVAELREQLRDLMFALDTQAKLAVAGDVVRDELQSGTLVVAPPAASASSSSSTARAGGGRAAAAPSLPACAGAAVPLPPLAPTGAAAVRRRRSEQAADAPASGATTPPAASAAGSSAAAVPSASGPPPGVAAVGSGASAGAQGAKRR